MTTECPFCGMDNAYCDGVEYYCPDCERSWECDELPDYDDIDDSDDDDDDFDCEVFVNGKKQ